MSLFKKKDKKEEKSEQPQQLPEEKPAEKKGLFARISQGLTKTRNELSSKIEQLLSYYKNIDDDFFDELEAVLLTADIGVAATTEIVQELRKTVKEQKIGDVQQIHGLLRSTIAQIMLKDTNQEEEAYPLLILVVGVNGVGKTTAIGKLAYKYTRQGKSVILAAGDTFRAAASEQLGVWAQRAGAQIIKHSEGADSAAVIFDAISAAKARRADVLICDTAGRLHNKKNLMDELAKIGRIINREWEGAKRTYIVLDATTGQNALSQAKTFSEAVSIDGIILTKLDGTAKGGVVVAIKKEMNLPVKFIGIGEGIDDLEPFNPEAFAQNII